MQNKKTDVVEFSKEKLLYYMMTSKIMQQMPQEEQHQLVWNLFRSPEETQKQFFAIFEKEAEITQKYSEEEAKATVELMTSYMSKLKMEETKFKNKLRQEEEGSERSKEQDSTETLLKNI